MQGRQAGSKRSRRRVQSALRAAESSNGTDVWQITTWRCGRGKDIVEAPFLAPWTESGRSEGRRPTGGDITSRTCKDGNIRKRGELVDRLWCHFEYAIEGSVSLFGPDI